MIELAAFALIGAALFVVADYCRLRYIAAQENPPAGPPLIEPGPKTSRLYGLDRLTDASRADLEREARHG